MKRQVRNPNEAHRWYRCGNPEIAHREDGARASEVTVQPVVEDLEPPMRPLKSESESARDELREESADWWRQSTIEARVLVCAAEAPMRDSEKTERRVASRDHLKLWL
jgi:hypothetical protein